MSRYNPFVLIALILCYSFIFSHAATGFASTAKDLYFEADACQRKLRITPQMLKYRQYWLSCIEKFQVAYRQDPSGAYAPAALFMSGQLYLDLYDQSRKPSDKKEALDLFERIIKRFPKSAYKQKAAEAIRSASKKTTVPQSESTAKAKQNAKPSPGGSVSEKSYLTAVSCQKSLLSDPQKRQYRHNWLSCINAFEKVYHLEPSGPRAAECLYTSGSMCRELYRYSGRTSDKTKALDFFRRVAEDYSGSEWAQRASTAMAEMSPAPGRVSADNKTKAPGKKPTVDRAADAASRKTDIEALLSETPEQVISIEQSRMGGDRQETTPSEKEDSAVTLVTGIRFWSNPNYTRVVVDADGETTYEHMVLKKDSSIKKPERLVVDLRNSRLKKDIEKLIPVDDNLLSDVRAGQNTPDVVRVVIDIKSMKSYKIFSLKNPYRIVVDLWGGEPVAEAKVQPSPKKKGEKLTSGALAKQLALGVRRIIIDPGHGGKDYGAPGYLKGIHEKNVILQIGKRLAEKIRRQLNCEVILTRDRDRYLTLEERTAFANTRNADLFISLHANSSTDKRAFGIETYYLNLATDDESIMVAARENATSTKNISDLQMILNDLMQNAKINESSRLAAHVQESLCNHLKTKYDRIKNKGVKQAPFYVLLGAQMPAILIETSFISNERECRRLISERYQDHVCDAVLMGIRNYIQEINPTALLKGSPKG